MTKENEGFNIMSFLFNNKSFIAAIPIKRLTECLQYLFESLNG